MATSVPVLTNNMSDVYNNGLYVMDAYDSIDKAFKLGANADGVKACLYLDNGVYYLIAGCPDRFTAYYAISTGSSSAYTKSSSLSDDIYISRVYDWSSSIYSRRNPQISPIYDSYQQAVNAIKGVNAISYIPVNCQLSGPSTVNSGDSVTVQVTPNEGHVISLPQQGGSISVYNENGYIPFTWDATNKTITFTAP